MRKYLFPPLILPFFILISALLIATIFLVTPAVFQLVFGLNYIEALTVFLLIILGSFVNIPIYEREGTVVVGRYSLFGVIYYTIAERRRIIVAVNLGGCIIPSILAIKLLTEIPIIPWLIAFIICTAVTYMYAKPVPGVGIAVPMILPPIVSALASYLVSIAFGLPTILIPKIAFSSGVLSALFGADILHLKDIEKIGSGVVSIGGAGTFDGIILTGIFAVFFSLFFL